VLKGLRRWLSPPLAEAETRNFASPNSPAPAALREYLSSPRSEQARPSGHGSEKREDGDRREQTPLESGHEHTTHTSRPHQAAIPDCGTGASCPPCCRPDRGQCGRPCVYGREELAILRGRRARNASGRMGAVPHQMRATSDKRLTRGTIARYTLPIASARPTRRHRTQAQRLGQSRIDHDHSKRHSQHQPQRQRRR
jgi:hypothetical protein